MSQFFFGPHVEILYTKISLQKIASKRTLSPKNIAMKILGPKTFWGKNCFGQKNCNIEFKKCWVEYNFGSGQKEFENKNYRT